MSDNFMMIVDAEVSLADAPAVSASVVAALRDRRLITGELTPDCVLGGSGFRLGPAIHKAYTPTPNEGRFWELLASGVEPKVQRSFNCWALGPSCEDFTCPICKHRHPISDASFADSVFAAVGAWSDQAGSASLLCSACNHTSHITNWQSTPPLGFGNLSFCFWNWPPFDLPAWNLDIPEFVRNVSGHKLVVTWGHI